VVRSWVLALAAVCLVSASALAEPLESRVQTFDLPSQPLDSALRSFCDLTGIQLLYESARTTGRWSSPLTGTFTTQAALQRLLKGTGLVARTTASEAFTLVPDESAPPSPDRTEASALPLDMPRMWRPFFPFLGSAQADIIAALCAANLLHPGQGSLSVRFRIAPSGGIAPVRLLHSSGDRVRDAAVIEALNRLTLDSPPPNLPQPVTLSIDSGSEQNPCALGPLPQE